MHKQPYQAKINLTLHSHQYSIADYLIRLLILLTVLITSPLSSADEAISLPISHSTNTIGEYLVVLKEQAQPLSLLQARQAYLQGRFSSWKKPVLSFGIGASPRWLVAQVDNRSDKKVTRRLVIENSWLDKADIYILHNDRLVKQLQLGDSFPFNERIIEHRFFAFDYDYAQGITQLFIRVETPDPMVLPIFFGTQEDSAARDVANAYSYGILYGIILALLFYNFILYLRLRLTRYLFYVIYLVMFMAMNLAYTGHSFSLFWPESAYWQQWMLPLLISLYAMSGIIFAFLFLQTHRLFPRIFYVSLLACLIFLFSQWLLFMYELQTIAVSTAIGFVIFFSVFTLFLASISLPHNRRVVIFFLVATVATLIGASITSMTVWSILPYNELFYRSVEIGMSIDVILLSIALAEKFRMMQKEKYHAEQLARLDPLTELYNRRAFKEFVVPILSNARRYKHNLSAIILDIDHFKIINDTYGHNMGDQVIKKTAETLLKVIRKGDISARWGGEEFTIIMPETGLTQARQLAERLRKDIAQLEIQTEAGSFSFTVSLGAAEITEGMDSIEDLIKIADTRLYQAKEAGRNRVY